MWTMPITDRPTWYHSNTYTADSACEHCEGIIRHENWCITKNEAVTYAYEAVLDAGKLSLGDRIILHALGVLWSGKVCAGSCKSLAAATAG
jgi:hypothetical protein